MECVEKPVAFVLISSYHGTMIVNKNDFCVVGKNMAFGVGFQLLNKSFYDIQEVKFLVTLLHRKRGAAGDGVVAIDGGANIGVHTIEWANAMHGWGEVLAFEAQEKIFYALAGNIAINNCLNVRARHSALGSDCGCISIPDIDYTRPASFGSLELRKKDNNEFIGQPVDYERTRQVDMVAVDSLGLQRLDLFKIDVEGMELDVLAGAAKTIAACRPIIWVEVIKSDKSQLFGFLESNGYVIYPVGGNALAVHLQDPVMKSIEYSENNITIH